jgi:hypothetical protein
MFNSNRQQFRSTYFLHVDLHFLNADRYLELIFIRLVLNCNFTCIDMQYLIENRTKSSIIYYILHYICIKYKNE